MFKTLKEVKNPDVLVVTPLLPNHDVSRETKVSIKRNNVKYTWIASIGDKNIPSNAQAAINFYLRYHKMPPFYIMIDRDIILGRNMLDKMVKVLNNYEYSNRNSFNIGYAYANFEFKGHINHKFPAIPFDINKLLEANYISSNSMFRMEIIKNIGLVTDDKYKRLLDWAFLIKCYSNGYIGVPVHNANFIAKSTKQDISAGDNKDYKLKYKRVYEDFIRPLLNNKKFLDKE